MSFPVPEERELAWVAEQGTTPPKSPEGINPKAMGGGYLVVGGRIPWLTPWVQGVNRWVRKPELSPAHWNCCRIEARIKNTPCWNQRQQGVFKVDVQPGFQRLFRKVNDLLSGEVSD